MVQIWFFLSLVFGVTWTICLFLRSIASQGELWTVLAWLFPTVWSPTLVAVMLLRSAGGAAGVREEIRARLTYRHGSGRWFILAGVVPPCAAGLAVFTARAAGDGGPFLPTAALPVMVVLQAVTGAVGEEFGWRGFLLPRLVKKFGEMTAAWAMSILWSLWHVAAIFVPGTPHHDLMPPIPSLLFTTLFGTFLAFVFSRTRGSVLVTMLAHLSVNVASGLGGVRLSSIVYWWTLVGVYTAIAFLITVVWARDVAKGRTGER